MSHNHCHTCGTYIFGRAYYADYNTACCSPSCRDEACSEPAVPEPAVPNRCHHFVREAVIHYAALTFKLVLTQQNSWLCSEEERQAARASRRYEVYSVTPGGLELYLGLRDEMPAGFQRVSRAAKVQLSETSVDAEPGFWRRVDEGEIDLDVSHEPKLGPRYRSSAASDYTWEGGLAQAAVAGEIVDGAPSMVRAKQLTLKL